jgi:hypothetical protein
VRSAGDPERACGRGAYSFAYFSLGIQRKVSRISCAASGETKRIDKKISLNFSVFLTSKKGIGETFEENILKLNILKLKMIFVKKILDKRS